MKVVLFGATGMVGQGVLRECLLAPDVEQVLAVVRSSTGVKDAKLMELVHADFTDFSAVADKLTGYDACFYCLGITSAGMTELEYTRVNYEFTMAAALFLADRNNAITFFFFWCAITDATERGRVLWARVKGKTENAVAAMPFKAAYMFRPGIIRPMHGIVSRTKMYRALYVVFMPLFPVLKALFPDFVTTTEKVGLAMLRAARTGAPKTVLETRDINALAQAP